MILSIENYRAAESTLCAVLDGLTESPCRPTANLAVPVEWNEYCDVCDQERRFVAERQTTSGLIAYCSAGCGNRFIADFSRAIDEEV